MNNLNHNKMNNNKTSKIVIISSLKALNKLKEQLRNNRVSFLNNTKDFNQVILERTPNTIKALKNFDEVNNIPLTYKFTNHVKL